jgi:NDP-sugar pyrophosphorylase family protein
LPTCGRLDGEQVAGVRARERLQQRHQIANGSHRRRDRNDPAHRLARPLDHFVEPVPAQQRTGLGWYRGSADAIFQNLNLIDDADPTDVGVFGADHVYKMDVSQMLRLHRKRGAELTIAAIPVPVAEAHQFGIMEVDANWRVRGFVEKPTHPPTIPGRPDWCLASMGNYFFTRTALEHQVRTDALREPSDHDFGRDIIPTMLQEGRAVFAYDFSQNHVPGQQERERGYWRVPGSRMSGARCGSCSCCSMMVLSLAISACCASMYAATVAFVTLASA